MKVLVSDKFSGRYFIPIKETLSLMSVSRSTLWRMERDHKFPKRVTIYGQKKGHRVDQLEMFYQGKWKGGVK